MDMPYKLLTKPYCKNKLTLKNFFYEILFAKLYLVQKCVITKPCKKELR